jgi:hypothetical protein
MPAARASVFSLSSSLPRSSSSRASVRASSAARASGSTPVAGPGAFFSTRAPAGVTRRHRARRSGFGPVGHQQAGRGHRLHEIAGRGLVDVHGPGEATHADVGLAMHDAQRPQLGAADAGPLLHLLEVRLDSIEHRAELAQHPDGGLGLHIGHGRRCLGGSALGGGGRGRHAEIIGGHAGPATRPTQKSGARTGPAKSLS